MFEALVRHTTPVAKPDCIEEPSVTTATVTMSRSLRDLGGSMALRRGVVLVVVAESIETDSILACARWITTSPLDYMPLT